MQSANDLVIIDSQKYATCMTLHADCSPVTIVMYLINYNYPFRPRFVFYRQSSSPRQQWLTVVE